MLDVKYHLLYYKYCNQKIINHTKPVHEVLTNNKILAYKVKNNSVYCEPGWYILLPASTVWYITKKLTKLIYQIRALS